MYTWNVRTGYLDTLATYTGLEFVGWALLPGKWVKTKSVDFWDNYVHLVNVNIENDRLNRRLETLAAALAVSKEEAAEVKRLRSLLAFEPPEPWSILGARVVAYRMGVESVLETLIVDRGEQSGVDINTPATTDTGVVGRVIRSSPFFSNVLLLTDRNSRIAVRGQRHRTPAILCGRGSGKPLELRYLPINARLEVGEILVTSGLDGLYPKGLPAAQITSVERSTEGTTPQTVYADALINVDTLEEVLLLKRNKLVGGASAWPHLIQ